MAPRPPDKGTKPRGQVAMLRKPAAKGPRASKTKPPSPTDQAVKSKRKRKAKAKKPARKKDKHAPLEPSKEKEDDEEEAWARGDVVLPIASGPSDHFDGGGDLTFVGGDNLASPQAGPSRLPYTPGPPSVSISSFTPLPRSILSGMARKSYSPSVGSSKTDIVVDPVLTDVESDPPPPPVAEHFQPPDLFSATLDTALKSSTITPTTARVPSDLGLSHGLLLPENITVDGENAARDGQQGYVPMEGVHFLDDNIQKGTTRYFVKEANAEDSFLATADQSKICQNCKKPGHRQKECPHIICTVCGVMDQHERRDCPHGLVCFGCGQRGHRQLDCPDPKSRHSKKRGCDRCGSRDHPETACPSIWRVYSYRSREDREAVRVRKRVAEGWAKEALAMSDDEEWCYNCAGSGHLGDDCPRPRASAARLFNPTAFSYAMASRGPFYQDRRSKFFTVSTPTHARWDDEDHQLPYSNPGFQGGDAGKRTREKSRQAMIDRENANDVSDEEENWFNGPVARTTSGSLKPSLSIRGRGGGVKARIRPRPWDSDARPTQGRNDPPREMPFGHAHLMASAPAARGKTLSLDQLNSPDQRTDSPSAGRSGGGKKSNGPPNQLLARAMQGARRAHPAQNGESSPSTPSVSASRRKTRKARGQDGDDDPESQWWSSGKAGGNVADWGKDMPSSKQGKNLKNAGAKAVKGQQYTGGY